MDRYRAVALAERLQPLDARTEADIRAMVASARSVTVIVRDADCPRSIANPFTFEERVEMLRAAFPDEMAAGILRATPASCHGYDDRARAAAVLRAAKTAAGSEEALFSGLTSEESEAASVRLAHPLTPPGDPADAFDLVARAARGEPDGCETGREVAAWLRSFAATEAFQDLCGELATVREVRRRYGPGPHGTADAICRWRDKVLLIERGNAPFRGCLAIPGGILDPGETPLDAAARELAEETCISGPDGPIPADAVKAAAVDREPRVYGQEWRDPRGRYVANAFVFDFSDLPAPPAVAAGDDARKAEWRDLRSLWPEDLAFDHFAMLHDLLGLPWPEPEEYPDAPGVRP